MILLQAMVVGATGYASAGMPRQFFASFLNYLQRAELFCHGK